MEKEGWRGEGRGEDKGGRAGRSGRVGEEEKAREAQREGDIREKK